ncbi:TfoX/Sxy family protein [Aequorivita marina]|uniref:TfoX/Sxy family protein n=1 Tax=Aequorivita marina TaxID=3073654 RepID=UPI0028761218|nr:TfoX/Sxy family protein [Aequorivita sp. S2608]MDS1299397.1 TfoX/Sxy family protein [Aequorivita sp. S2608]
MAVSNDFTQFVLDQLSGWGNVQVKRMFGGAALYQDDLAFSMIANDVVYLKVDETNKAKFIESGSVPLKPFKNNATVLSFYNVPAHIVEDADAFIRWAKESLEIQKKRQN